MSEPRDSTADPSRRTLLESAWRRLHEAGCPLPGLEARLLVCHVCRCAPEALAAHDELAVSAAEGSALDALVARRVAGEPMAYLLGEREFWGRSFRVDRRVLVPRPETEHLVEAVLDLVPRGGSGLRLLDVGTGSGIVAVTLALEGAFREVLASDVSARALELAAENAETHGAAVEFRSGDLYEVLAAGEQVDVLVSNPPYVASEALETLGLDHEPRLALDGGPDDGTVLLDRLVDGLVRVLTPGGLAFFEIGSDQGSWARRRHETTDGVELVELRRDLAGLDRVAVFRRATDPERKQA